MTGTLGTLVGQVRYGLWREGQVFGLGALKASTIPHPRLTTTQDPVPPPRCTLSHSHRLQVRTMQAPCLFGIFAVFSGEPRLATVYCAESVDCWLLQGAAFQWQLHMLPGEVDIARARAGPRAAGRASGWLARRAICMVSPTLVGTLSRPKGNCSQHFWGCTARVGPV